MGKNSNLNFKVHNVSYIPIAFFVLALIYSKAAKTCISILLRKNTHIHKWYLFYGHIAHSLGSLL